MSTQKRVQARIKGISVAAKVATVGGLAVAALALVEARAAASAPASRAAGADIAREASADDTARASTETLFKVNAGNCGCAPCWGPPAPPAKRIREERGA